MGIQGFEKYLMCQHKRSCPRVKIEYLVDKFRAEAGKAKTELIIDSNNLMRELCAGLEGVLGGQFTEFSARLLSYVKRLTDVGISPVFFFDGAVAPTKLGWWAKRKFGRVERIKSWYWDCGSASAVDLTNIGPAGLFECTILTLRAANYPMFFTQSHGDLEMARYAREHGCFAILSRDTDFVILSGARYYLSLFPGHFESSDMTTILFDRAGIAEDLGLRPEELPLLAALMHNDHVDGRFLVPLYSKLLGRSTEALRPEEYYNKRDLVPRLAKLVRDDLVKQDDPVDAILSKTYGGYPPFLLRNLARELGLQNAPEMQDKLRAQLKLSLAMHDFGGRPASTAPQSVLDVGDVDPDVLERAMARHRAVAFLTPSVLTLLLHRIMVMDPGLEDPRLPASRSTEGALRMFRRRIYGLLQVKGPFTEWVLPNRAPDPGQEFEPCVVEAITPDPGLHPHPGLLALWDDDEPDVVADRWRLLAWALAAHRPVSACVDVVAEGLRKLPRHLAVPTATLYLLYHSGVLDGLARPAGELVALLARTCLAARRATIDVLDALTVEHYDCVAVHVAAVFMRTSGYLAILNDVLGAPVALDQLHPELYFNGKIFHCMFSGEALDQSLFDSSSERLEERMVLMVMRQEESEE